MNTGANVMRRFCLLIASGCLAALLAPAPVMANGEPVADRVNFRVEVGAEIDNDRLVALLSVTAEDKVPADLAESINRDMQWALDQTRGAPGVDTRSGGYHTYPVYDDRKIVNWRARQELHLESANAEEIARLIGVLQARLQVQSLQFSVSPDRRTEVEERLVEKALAAYQERAAVISKSLSAKSYRLLDVTIDTGRRDPVIPLRGEMALASRAQTSPPALESGTTRITVQASGSIQLLR